jgi:hypothetical protein
MDLHSLGWGVVAGLLVVAFDWIARQVSDFAGFPHPHLPASLLASLSAAIGEEILFRLFVMSLWMVILSWLLRRFLRASNARYWSLWIANAIAALAFAASHLGTAKDEEIVVREAHFRQNRRREESGLTGTLHYGLLGSDYEVKQKTS